MDSHSDAKQNIIKKELFEWIKAILIAILIAYIIRTFLFSVYVVDGDSMLKTLSDNERVIVNEMIYNIKDPQFGDIIVFSYDNQHDFIKRVIGLPGDTIEIINNQLYINEEIVQEPYLDSSITTGNFGPIEIEENQLFVLGDNRGVSMDSRSFGTISQKDVVGRVNIVFWPLNSIRLIN